MQLQKESLQKFQACWDSNLDLCDTGATYGATLLKSGTMLYNYVCKECMERLKGIK